MSSVLKQLALLIGGLLFLVALGLGLMHGLPIPVVLFRATMVFLIGSVAIGVFFRFFATILYNFVLDKMEDDRRNQENAPSGILEGLNADADESPPLDGSESQAQNPSGTPPPP